MKKLFLLLFINCVIFAVSGFSAVRLKTLTHFSGLQENAITGYGLVIGLAGSGDSQRNKETIQAIANLLQSFGVNLAANDINSRNTATVIVTANLPSYVHQGDKLDINVASLGDAKSLLGGTLLVTPLKGVDDRIYALAQGPISLGGYKYDVYGNVVQKNHPTSGIISGGAIVEKNINTPLINLKEGLHLILNRPDFTTADHIETAINRHFGEATAKARSAQDIEIHPIKGLDQHFIRFVSELENLSIVPDTIPTVVVNERTGIVIASSEVSLEAVNIAQGNLQISISNQYNVSQPATLVSDNAAIRSIVTPISAIHVREENTHSIQLAKGASITDLISALNKLHTSTRDIIAILESIKRAGALHAELIIE